MWPEVVADIVSDEKDDKDSLNLYFSGVATETDKLTRAILKIIAVHLTLR